MSEQITIEELIIIKKAQNEITVAELQYQNAKLFAENCLLKIYNKYNISNGDSILETGEIKREKKDEVIVKPKFFVGEIVKYGNYEAEIKSILKNRFYIVNYINGSVYASEEQLEFIEKEKEIKPPKFKVGDEVIGAAINNLTAYKGKIISLFYNEEKDTYSYNIYCSNGEGYNDITIERNENEIKLFNEPIGCNDCTLSNPYKGITGSNLGATGTYCP